MKFESSGSKGTQVIEQKRSVTDGQGRQTDKAKTIEGGDITRAPHVGALYAQRMSRSIN